MLENFIFSFFQISVSCSLLIVLLLLFRNIITNRYYAKTTKLLWTIIAIRFLLPIGIPFIQPIYKIKSSTAQQPSVQGSITQITQLKQTVSLGTILFIIWCIGFVLFIGFYVVNYNMTFRRMNRWSIYVTDKDTLNCFEEIKQDLKIRKKIGLKQSNYISSPVLIGLFKVTVYIPNTEISPSQLPLILKHELLHYKKKDIWCKLLMVLVTAFHWYNPLVYIMANKFNADIETACDEAVLSRTNYRNKKDYANAILRTVELNQKQRILLSTHFSENSCTIRKRLDKILVYRKKNKGIILCFIITTLLLSAGSLVGFTPVSAQQQKQDASAIINNINNKQQYFHIQNNPYTTQTQKSDDIVIITYEPVAD
ncbi:M56 family metallopeptidase [Paludicola sp. MB14-C6]|uniref:M56 family metallopeptidase n=1 Tax=Paludihabitans sp. MB14-C6 TaxID=3070656 RepID=UPI0027DB775B|nr:M56 family metallopeptidase [Paludicola sp. MB14-C6]WMJ23086.1 M56 family metallopeptidase [Paludicola sp. MB14-C6]